MLSGGSSCTCLASGSSISAPFGRKFRSVIYSKTSVIFVCDIIGDAMNVVGMRNYGYELDFVWVCVYGGIIKRRLK